MNLEELGYNQTIQKEVEEQGLGDFKIGRVITEHKERYIVASEQGNYEAEVLGNLRYTAQSREDFPAVGDWVTLSIYDESMAIIHKVMPRTTMLKRQMVGSKGETQLIVTNIDIALIVQAVDRDFNINRLERYLTICKNAGIEPYILLTKTDLLTENKVEDYINLVKARIKDVLLFAISSETGYGYETLQKHILKGKTYCLLGSSCVGKSTLLNYLMGEEAMKTATISENTNKGKHTTTHRELLVLKNGAIIIDNPGIREVGIADGDSGLAETFDEILAYAENCKYADCTHTVEKGCAVLQALNNGEIDESSYRNYLKLEREKEHYIASAAEKRQKDKDFGKMIKNFKSDMNKLSDKHNY